MLECTNCSTMNPTAEAACLSCGSALTATSSTGIAGATGISGATGRCPAGHPVDPGWKTCPYCDRQQAGGPQGDGRATRLEAGGATPPPAAAAKRTRLEGAAPPRPVAGTRLAGEPPSPRAAPANGPQRTRLEEPEPVRGRATVLHDDGGGDAAGPPATSAAAPAPAPSAAPAAGEVAAVRRLVAVLAAPDVGAGGSVFAVRSGRNTLGSGRGNDIVLDADAEVSREHAVILHRNGTFHFADRLSTNGTWVNDREVPANGTVAIEDRDRIRLGRSELVFLRLDTPSVPRPD